jgi:hypothetical protein
MRCRVLRIDLAEDRGLVPYQGPTPGPQPLASNLLCKRQFGSGFNADRNARIFRGGKTSGAPIEFAGGEKIADFSGSGLDSVKAVVAHSRALPMPPRRTDYLILRSGLGNDDNAQDRCATVPGPGCVRTPRAFAKAR